MAYRKSRKLWTRWMLLAILLGTFLSRGASQLQPSQQSNSQEVQPLQGQQGLTSQQGQQMWDAWQQQIEIFQQQQAAWHQQLLQQQQQQQEAQAQPKQQELLQMQSAEWERLVQQQLDYLYESFPLVQQQLQPLDVPPSNRLGRNLKQVVYTGTVDPYQGGVTPGFVNYDSNAVTGTHFDIGGFVFDKSADGNYIGFAFGDLFGVGIARDRGWTVQIGGGNILDVSVTRDGGIGIWVLNGLLNLNWSPNGKWTVNTAADQGMGSSITGNNGATEVVVDDDTAIASNSTVTTTAKTNVASAAAAAAVTVVSSRPNISNTAYTSATSAVASSGVAGSGTSTPADESQVWTVQGQYSGTANMNAAASGTFSSTAGSSSSGIATSCKACEGGEVVWVTGTRYKCKYPRTLRVASAVQTYTNGIAV